MSGNVRRLADALEELDTGSLVLVTGAGISSASGIPTFRGTDKDAIWKRDITELATYRYFREDPVGSWRWYLENFLTLGGKQPNPAHWAAAALERWHRARGGPFVLVTQNIDMLHEAAGSQEMIKVHGSSDRVRCGREGCPHGAPTGSLPRDAVDITPFLEAPSLETVPRCPECGDTLRQHVLWFDEYYNAHRDYQWDRVRQSARTMQAVLFVGTSFSVGVTDLFVQSAVAREVPAFSVDPGGAAGPSPGVQALAEPAEELLPAVCAALGARMGI